MLRKRRAPPGGLKTFGPLVASTLRQQRKAYSNDHDGDSLGDTLVASYNVHKCVGRDRRFNPWRTLSVIKEIDADIVALQEVDQRFGERTGLLDLHALEQECGLRAVPLKGVRASHGWRGNLVLVRNGRIDGVQQLVLPGAEPRGAVVVDLTLASGPLRVIAAHLGLLHRSRIRQVRAILMAAEAGDARPAVLMGDFNEWRLGRRSSLQALDPNFGPLEGAVASFPSRFPVWSLDRILANPRELVSHIEVHDTPLAHVASDHLPIKAAIRLADADRSEPRSSSRASLGDQIDHRFKHVAHRKSAAG